jgi:hypothetical protein
MNRTGSRGSDAAARATELLSFAAAPTFALMAGLTALFGGAPDVLCSGTMSTGPLNGMGVMYALMSAFHSAPWLRRISGPRDPAAERPSGRAQEAGR